MGRRVHGKRPAPSWVWGRGLQCCSSFVAYVLLLFGGRGGRMPVYAAPRVSAQADNMGTLFALHENFSEHFDAIHLASFWTSLGRRLKPKLRTQAHPGEVVVAIWPLERPATSVNLVRIFSMALVRDLDLRLPHLAKIFSLVHLGTRTPKTISMLLPSFGLSVLLVDQPKQAC
eukprot:6193037-Pleurochrysis_carterae.AAC.1